MSKSRLTTPSRYRNRRDKDHRAAITFIGTNRLNQEINEFVQYKNPDKRLKTIERVEALHVPGSARIAGEMCLDLARHSKHDAIELFERAGANLIKAVRNQSFDTNYPRADSIRARRMLNLMPYFFCLIVYGELPSAEWQNKVYENSISTSVLAVNSLLHYQKINEHKYNVHKRDEIEMVGEVAEQTVGLLGMRFGLLVGDSSWVMMPSFFSEDHDKLHLAGHEKHCWDQSVYTSPKGLEQPTYKIQVKNRRRLENPFEKQAVEYDDSIIVLYARDHLTLPNERLVHTKTIIKECNIEQACTSNTVSARLNDRTEQLLDLLG